MNDSISVKDSILNTIKKMLGINEEYTEFDIDILVYINSVFATLTQIGVGPKQGFAITDEQNKWSEYENNTIFLDSIKNYIYLKVRLEFDPPTNSTAVESLKQMIKELEFRIQLSSEMNNEEDKINGTKL